jgi:macrolide-specific efflux system membrane fusion protein
MNETTSPVPGRRRKSSGRRRAILFAVVVAAAGGGWYGWHTYSSKAAAEGEYLFDAVDRGDIEDLVASTGALQPREFVDVGAQVSGQIEKLHVEVGDVVTAGQLLASIDATTAQAKVDANEASIQSAKSNLKTQQNQLDKAKRDAERQKRLYDEGATTYESMINAQTSYEDNQSRLEQSRSQLVQQEANARIEANNLRYTKIIAPIAGTIMSIAVKQGQTVNATQNVPNVMQIANLDTMTIQSDVSEADVAKLYPENPVYFTTLGGQNRKWWSKLKRIEPTPKVSNSVVTYNALFDIENEGTSLRPSMTAQVYFVAAEARNVKRVPMAALQQGQQIARALAAKEGRKPAAPPGAPGNAAANAPGAAAAAGGSAPATPAAQAPGGAGGDPANRQANAQGNRPASAQGAPGGQRPGGSAATEGNRGNFGGARPGGAGGNFNGPRPGGGRQNLTPEQIAEYRSMRGGGAGGGGGAGPGGGNFGNFGRGGMAVNVGGAASSGPRPVRRTNGIVMVRKADRTLEQRQVVVGVTDRVLGEVLEGLEEGEVVVIGKSEPESASASQPRNNNNNNQGGFPTGGGNFQGGGNRGGGGRPF